MLPGEMVEAAGIEPASEIAFTKATTCVAEALILTASIPLRQGIGLASS